MHAPHKRSRTSSSLKKLHVLSWLHIHTKRQLSILLFLSRINAVPNPITSQLPRGDILPPWNNFRSRLSSIMMGDYCYMQSVIKVVVKLNLMRNRSGKVRHQGASWDEETRHSNQGTQDIVLAVLWCQFAGGDCVLV